MSTSVIFKLCLVSFNISTLWDYPTLERGNEQTLFIRALVSNHFDASCTYKSKHLAQINPSLLLFHLKFYRPVVSLMCVANLSNTNMSKRSNVPRNIDHKSNFFFCFFILEGNGQQFLHHFRSAHL